MAKFQKKPVVVDAWQVPSGTLLDLKSADKFCSGACGMAPDAWGYAGGGCIVIHTLEGEMMAEPGDYIIKGVKGEFYPCKPDIFELTYTPVAE